MYTIFFFCRIWSSLEYDQYTYWWTHFEYIMASSTIFKLIFIRILVSTIFL